MRPGTLAETVRKAHVRGDWRDPLAEFLDGFYVADPVDRAWRIARDPGTVGDAVGDAYLGAVGEHLARRWDLPVPGWVRDPSRYLEVPRFEPDVPALRDYLLRFSPVAFRSRLLFVGAEPLQRKGFSPGSDVERWLRRRRTGWDRVATGENP